MLNTQIIAETHDKLANNPWSNGLFALRAASFSPRFLADGIQNAAEAPQGEVSVLDIGCNQGHKTNLILETVANLGGDVSRFLGVDLSQTCIDRAKGKNKRPNVFYEQCDFLGPLPIKEQFDYVFLFAIWHHISSTRSAVERIRDVLKPDGLALVLNGFYPESPILRDYALYLQQLYRYVECRGTIPYDVPLVSSTIRQFEEGGLACKGSFRTNFPTNLFNTHALVFQEK